MSAVAQAAAGGHEIDVPGVAHEARDGLRVRLARTEERKHQQRKKTPAAPEAHGCRDRTALSCAQFWQPRCSAVGRSSHNPGTRKCRIENDFTPLLPPAFRPWKGVLPAGPDRWEPRSVEPPSGSRLTAICFESGERRALRGAEHAVMVAGVRQQAERDRRATALGQRPQLVRLARRQIVHLVDVQAELLVVAQHLDAPVDSLRIGLEERLLRERPAVSRLRRTRQEHAEHGDERQRGGDGEPAHGRPALQLAQFAAWFRCRATRWRAE